jgi:hypothetical protein
VLEVDVEDASLSNDRHWPTAAIQPSPPIGRLADTGDGTLATHGRRSRPVGPAIRWRLADKVF